MHPVFEYFQKICSIPHGSGNEKALSDYLYKFAIERGLYVFQDHALNIIIKKKGTIGYETSAPVILQGHMDMVCEQNSDTNIDFLVDPIVTFVDGDFIRARGSSLGADNGIALAYCLALLDSSDIPHPPLEIVFTTEEEIGLNGAKKVDEKLLGGRYLINLDSEDEGILYAGCAGGLVANIHIPLILKAIPENYETYRISVRGLQGGHSGMEIHRGLGNSVIIIAGLFEKIRHRCPDMLVKSLDGGSKNNAIPREADAVIGVPKGFEEQLRFEIDACVTGFKKEFAELEPDFSITYEKETEGVTNTGSAAVIDNITPAILLMPDGAQSMSRYIPGLVESSNNVGVVKIQYDELLIICGLRSSSHEKLEKMRTRVDLAATLCGGTVTYNEGYPAWEYKADSPFRDLAAETFNEMYGREPKITAVHAGLECGIFAEKIPGLDILSFGPNILYAHTPDERISIRSTERIWDYLVKLLCKMK